MWEELWALTPLNAWTKVYLGADKNPKQVATEVSTKRLGAIIESNLSAGAVSLARREGVVLIDMTPVALILPQSDGSTNFRWNDVMVAKHTLQKETIIATLVSRQRQLELPMVAIFVQESTQWLGAPSDATGACSLPSAGSWNGRGTFYGSSAGDPLRAKKLGHMSSLVAKVDLVGCQETHASHASALGRPSRSSTSPTQLLLRIDCTFGGLSWNVEAHQTAVPAYSEGESFTCRLLASRRELFFSYAVCACA